MDHFIIFIPDTKVESGFLISSVSVITAGRGLTSGWTGNGRLPAGLRCRADSVLAVLGTECNHSMTRLGKNGYHFLSATFGQVIREEPPVTDNDSEGDGMWLGVLM